MGGNRTGSTVMRTLSCAGCLTLIATGPLAAADLPGDASAGGDLAREVCAVCHVVARDQDDPGVGAPSFLELAAHPSVTELSLRAFFQTPHATMPDLMLTRDETDDIITYILSLKGG